MAKRHLAAARQATRQGTMDPHETPHRERLWTPWRMRYIGGGAREQGCIFCTRLARGNDVDSLILHRSDHAFAIMNLYPYNTGHVMVVPNRHEADLDQLDEATQIDMATLLPKVLTALRSVLGCDGFNIGLNLGSVAGAGIADHLHQHVVPRWEGDANFMPIIAGTMVIPEMIPSSYAKFRAELSRNLLGDERFDIVVISDADKPLVWLRNGHVPSIDAEDEKPVWRTAVSSIATSGSEIVGWSGPASTTDRTSRPGLVIRVDDAPAGHGWRPASLEQLDHSPIELESADRETIQRAVRQLAPWIAGRNG
ncbi:MAG TPA: HIT domain-containing protein [Thermomicrobiales bacterium]|nr:HIT domain-containing protein [Thermomicrobiales bacterium]